MGSQFYLLILFSTETVHIPGDERSRSAPGHGYPEETRTFDTPHIWAYNDAQEMSNDMEKLFRLKPDRTDLMAVHVDLALRPVTGFRLEPI